LESLLCNRAACNLELSGSLLAVLFSGIDAVIAENYGSVLRDCSKALTLNPKSSKAYYRSALACLSLGRLADGLDCCTRCLSYDPSNAGIKSIQERLAKAKEETERKERERAERIAKEEEEKMKLKIAFRVSGPAYSSASIQMDSLIYYLSATKHYRVSERRLFWNSSGPSLR